MPPLNERPDELVLLVGPPNVGKSVIFNQLTGVDVGMANYPGTTVDFTRASVRLGGRDVTIIDAPGTYSLSAANEAEEVTVALLARQPSVVVCVLDAGHLQTDLHLLFEVLKQERPTVLVLNRVDLLHEKGRSIDVDELARGLGVAVVETVAVTGSGMVEVRNTVEGLLLSPRIPPPIPAEWSWKDAELMASRVLRGVEGAPSRRQLWGDLLMRPWPGLPLAIAALAVSVGLMMGMGMMLRQWLLLPLFRGMIIPWIVGVVEGILPAGIFRSVMIGEYGFLTKGLEWPFTLVMPYVLSFYLILSVLEDSGYLPRLGVLLDGLLNRIGLSGQGVIPILLGYGCGIPAIMSSRALESRRQRALVAILVSLSVPCIAQTGAFISLMAASSAVSLVALGAVAVLALAGAGTALNRLMPGVRPPTLMEVPELLMPRAGVIAKKLWVRTKHYLADAVPPVIGGVAFAALLYETGMVLILGRALRPVVSWWLMLPEEAAVPLLLGIFRRELTVLPLLDMSLSPLQLFVGATVALLYVPCIAMVAVLIREFGARFAGGVLLGTTAVAFAVGGFLARLGNLFL